MTTQGKITPDHLRRLAYLYVRQSSLHQVQGNQESTKRQYDLKRRARALGWSPEQIVVIDEDQGLSGASATERKGFQRLVAEVGLGRVGVVIGLEVSRLARNSSDWHRLLEICALAATLILDEDGIYDPSHFNDRLLLGLKGTMSEAELHVLRARLIGGQLNKARRGELWMRPPIGFVYDHKQRLVFDPDKQIRDTVQLLFDTFRRAGSALAVVRHFTAKGVLWPRRISTGVRAGEVVFGDLELSRVLQVLHNPRYAGAYVYGRTWRRKTGLDGQARYHRLKREQWKVFLPNAHPGYIAWQEFEANQTKLLDNANGYGPDRRKSPPREGTALLQGLVICGSCGGRMTVRYDNRKGHPVPSYVCQRRSIETAQPLCQNIPGRGLDEAVSQAVLAAINPASLDVTLQVFEELRVRKAELERIRQARVERAREEAELARRQYMLVRPENRLVADSLEREWNESLALLAQAEDDYARAAKEDPAELSAEDKERIRALALDLPRLWKEPRTPYRDRKRMIRLLIEDVTLKRAHSIQIHIRWKGGATTSLHQPLPVPATDLFRTPASIVEHVRALAARETDAQIAHRLNARSLRTGRGNLFTRGRVRNIRIAHGIESLTEHLRQAGWMTSSEMADSIGVHKQTVHRFAREGVLRACRPTDRKDLLFAPISGPLPKAHPGKRLKDRRRYPQCHPKTTSNMQDEVQYEA
jgi:DNA invertase Pin-like site-specific DNA recombinase